MANLLDTIRGNNAAIGTQQQGVTDQTQSLQGLLRAKSGKSIAAPAVASSNLGEQQAVVQTNQTLQNQIAPAASLQNQAMGQQAQQQQQQQNIQTQQVAQGRKFDTMQNKIQTDAVLSDLERNKGQVDLNRDRAKMEQVGFQLRLQDQQYLDNLQREGNKQRLSNDMQFKQELAASVLGDNKDLLEKQIGNKSVLDTNARDFNNSMAQMDINTAYDMFKNEMQTAQERQKWQAISGIAQAGIGAAGASGAFSSSGPKSTPAQGPSNAFSSGNVSGTSGQAMPSSGSMES